MSLESLKAPVNKYAYPLAEADREAITEHVIEALKNVYDPHVSVNIYSLGLIYKVDLDSNGFLLIEMTLTSMGCPHAQQLISSVEDAINRVDGIVEAEIKLVWDPPWQIPEALKLELGVF